MFNFQVSSRTPELRISRISRMENSQGMYLEIRNTGKGGEGRGGRARLQTRL